MKIKRMRNNVKLTDVIISPDKSKTYAFGFVLDGAKIPSFVFFPPRIVEQYEIGPEDVGAVLDCIFRDDERKRNKRDPVVMAILEDTDPIGETIMLDEFDSEEGPRREDAEADQSANKDLPEFITG